MQLPLEQIPIGSRFSFSPTGLVWERPSRDIIKTDGIVVSANKMIAAFGQRLVWCEA